MRETSSPQTLHFDDIDREGLQTHENPTNQNMTPRWINFGVIWGLWADTEQARDAYAELRNPPQCCRRAPEHPSSGRVRGGIIGRGIDTENSDEWNPTRRYLLRMSADFLADAS